MQGTLRVLSIEVIQRGFSFAVLEGPERLVEWGNRTVKGDTSVFLAKLSPVIDRYRPDVLALEEPALSWKGDLVKERLSWAEQFAVDRDQRVVALPRAMGSKDTRAAEVARLFPELSSYLPKPRRRWHGEARAIPVFVAVERGVEAISRLADSG